MPVDVESQLVRLGEAWSESVAHVDVAEVLERTMSDQSPRIDGVGVPSAVSRHGGHIERRLRRSRQRWLVAAACTALVAGGLVAVAQQRDGAPEPTPPVASVPLETVPPPTADTVPPSTLVPATQESPFLGTWLSTGAHGSSQTMYIDRWDSDIYQVRVRDEVAIVCEGIGRPGSETTLVVVRLESSTHHVSSCDEASFLPSSETQLVLTLDSTSAADQLVDSLGVVWREQDAPPPAAGDIALLEAFLAARVAGEGAEQYVGQGFSRDDRVPLLYATTSGDAYERFEIGARVRDPDGTRNYDVRLFTADGTVIQQRFMVQNVVVYGGPTLEDGDAVPLPFSILDGEVSFGVTSSWEVESFDDAHMAFWHRFGSSAIVIAAEPLSVWPSCENRPAPATAEALARSIVTDSAHEVTEPVPVRIAGIDGLQIDVAISGQAGPYLCTFDETGTLSSVQSGGTRMRLFMVDHPGGSTEVVTFAVMTTPDEFEDAIAEIAPMIETVQFRLD